MTYPCCTVSNTFRQTKHTDPSALWAADKTYTGTPIVRRGAISAKQGEKLIIPINMQAGVILGTGLGNDDWNQSAPHGAGRIYRRSDMKGNFTVSQYKKVMKGIYSSCIDESTLDEAPFAYRNLDDISKVIGDTAKIDKIIRPIYNFKAGKDLWRIRIL